MEILGMTQFDRCVLEMSLIHLSDRQSYVGQEMYRRYNAWKEETAEPTNNPWLDLHRFAIYLPHPQQEYENITLAEGLTRGYNIEVEPVRDRAQIPYQIPDGGHFAIVLKQRSQDSKFKIAATGIFVRSLAILSLDFVIDPEKGEYRPLTVKHPIVREYPPDWEKQLAAFLKKEIGPQELPNIVGYVDRDFNQDYRPPAWDDLYRSTATGLV